MSVDLKQFRAFLSEQALADKTIRTYINSISRMLEKHPDEPTKMVTRSNLSNASRHTYRAALVQWATHTDDEKLFAALGSVTMKRQLTKITRGTNRRKKKVQPFSAQEVDAILSIIDDWKTDLEQPIWLWASLSLLIKLGLRAGADLAWLERSRVVDALENGRTLVIVTKGAKERDLPVIPIMTELKELASIEGWKYLSDLISPSARKGGGADAAYQVISRKLKAAAELAGIDVTAVHTHRFRHTAAHRLYEDSGGDILLVQALLGHNSSQTTVKYLGADRIDKMASFLMQDEEE